MNLKTLWIYQSERFPLTKTAPIVAVFSAASICVSAELAGRPLPGWGAFIAGFVIALLLFFQLRVCDEYKDLEDDKRYRPSRPIPRGLVTLKSVIALGVLSLPITALTASLWYPPTLWLLAVVWIWLAAMTLEFGVPEWLKARPVLYLVSHMAIMPLIDLLLTGIEWLPHRDAAPALVLFLFLSFVNGCVLEIGRKLWAPENEIAGVDTYSGLWGAKKAAQIWALFVLFSYALLLGVCAATGVFWIGAILGGLGVAYCMINVRNYAANPTPTAEKRMDTIAGLWVFACYAIAGFTPFLVRLF